VNPVSDLPTEVITRALKAVAGEIPGALHSELGALVASGRIYDGRAIAAAIAKAVDVSVPNAN
jgi:hypothetical protein